MFEQAFKNIDDVLRKEAGCTTELDYTEQTSWLLFLKYLDNLEDERANIAKLEGRKYVPILEKAYQWESWAAPKDKNGKLDHNKALSGDDLRDFVNLKLFPYLQGFKKRASGPNTIEYKIGEIFGEIKNKIQSGYNLREVLDHIDELQFRSQVQKHELSHLYESKIRNMGNAGRNGGEYYTPRPLIRAIIQVVKPKIGDRIYDGAVGSAGFLCESYEYLTKNKELKTKDIEILQKKTFFAKEKKSLAYVIAIMNMILHGIEAPNVIHTNTLTENLADIQEKDRVEVIMANPPFGGSERKEIQQNFPIRTSETAYLFLQHFIRMLKGGGRAGVVIKNTFLSNTDNASVSLRKMLLESCRLHTVLDLPSGTFQGATGKTVVLFFEKGAPTKKIWYYQVDPARNPGKTNPLNDDDLAEFVKLQRSFAASQRSWTVETKTTDQITFDLSVKNPNGGESLDKCSPSDVLDEISALDRESAKLVREIAELENCLPSVLNEHQEGWKVAKLRDIAEYFIGLTYAPEDVDDTGTIVLRSSNIQNDRLDLSDLVRVNRQIKEELLVRSGDILMCSRNGSKKLVGKTAMISDLQEKMTFGTFMMIIRSPRNPYLYWFFKSRRFRAQIGAGENPTIKQITKYMLDDISVPLPPPAEEEKVVRHMVSLNTKTEQLRSIFEQKLAAVDTLKALALGRVFTATA